MNTLTDRKNEINYSIRNALEFPLIYFILFIAFSNIILMLGLQISVKFHLAASWIVFSIFIPFIFQLSYIFNIHKLKIFIKGNNTNLFILLIFLISSISGIFATSINRPDIDDSIYVAKAVFYTENINSKLDTTINSIVGIPETEVSGLFQYYETIQAALAYSFNTHFLTVYHIVFPAIVGFLMCISMFLVISLFVERRWPSLFGLLFLIFIIISLGETHRSFGNLSIARAFHGKYMFLAVGVPAWIYFSLQFLRSSSLRTWLILNAIGIGMAGTSSTAMVFLPLLSILISISYSVELGKECLQKKIIYRNAAYFLSLAPLVLMALNFYTYAKANYAVGSIINSEFPSQFHGQLDLLSNPDLPLTLALFFSSLVALLYFPAHRRFFISWIIVAFILYLNPIVSGLIMNNITSENIYWRLFYLLPFPIIVGIAYASFIKNNATSTIISSLLMMISIYFAIWGPTSVIRLENGASLDRPQYKINQSSLSAIKKITENVPSGSMFAPLDISSNLLIYSAKYRQFHMREDYLRFILTKTGKQVEFSERSNIFNFLYENESNQKNRQAFEKLISSIERPRLIVTDNYSSNKEEIYNIMKQHNYRKILLINDKYSMSQEIY